MREERNSVHLRFATLTNTKGTTILSSYSYTYDENGNILTINETVEGISNNVSYGYDKLNRIASTSGTKGADSYYEYDYRGNRKVNFEQIDFLSEESAQFRYNEQDQMYYANVGDDAVYIEYDASGYRYVKESSSSGIEFYIYDKSGRLQAIADLAVVTVDGTTKSVMYPVKQYIWGPDRVLAQVDIETGGIYYYLYNGHGDVVQIVDRNGNIKNRYDYDVWGNFLQKEETIENHFTYFGQTYDEETGLYYLRARYYDPTTGRFTQQDPAEDGYNWYVYGNQNPVMYVDETGKSVTAYGVTASIGVGVAGYEGMYLWATDDKGNFALLVVHGYSSSIGASLGGIAMYFPDMPQVSSMYG